MENAARMGEFLLAGLKAIASRHPAIGDVRGKGLMIGVELVDPAADGSPAPKAAEQLVQSSFQKGLLLLRCGESSVRLCPPLVITRPQAETALAIIEEVLVEMEEGDVHRTSGGPGPEESAQAEG